MHKHDPVLRAVVQLKGVRFDMRNILLASAVVWGFLGGAARAATVGALEAQNALSEISANAAAARVNLGLGTMATQGAGAVAVTGGTLANATISNSTGGFTSLNVTGAGYQIGGVTVLNSTAGSAPILLGGQFSGASITSPSQTQFITGFGAYTFESAPGYPTVMEGAAIGMGACIAQTAAGSTCFGASSGAAMTTAGIVALGNDSGRDVWDVGGSVAVGAGSYVDGGNGVNAANLVIGTNTYGGNAGTVTMGGSITLGDQLKFTFTSANACNGTTITVNCTTNSGSFVTYTVVSGDTTLALLATHVASLMASAPVNYILGDGVTEGTHNLFALVWSIGDPTNHPTVIKGHFPGSWQVSVAYSCAGTCGETATVAGPSTGGFNTIVGNSTLQFFGLTTASQNTMTGYGNAGNFVTTASQNTFDGMNIAVNLSTGSQNDVSGYLAGTGLTTGSQNVIHGSYAEQAMTSGSKNTILGDHTTAGGGGVTTGSNNIELGQGAVVQSPTVSNQMSAQNIIYGTGNAGGGTTLSTGQIGIAVLAPNATFTVGDAGGTSVQGSHIGVLQTTAPTVTNATLDAHASDVSGTLTLTAANPVVTFHVAFATVPHCIVSSPSGTAFTYAAATGTLTLTGGASGNTASYVCVQ